MKTFWWFGKKWIDSAPRTPQKNGLAEHSEGVIVAQAHAIRIEANTSHDLCLWKEIVNTVVNLHNRTRQPFNARMDRGTMDK